MLLLEHLGMASRRAMMCSQVSELYLVTRVPVPLILPFFFFSQEIYVLAWP